MTTATGSGLTGGGASGSLSLGLLNTCATNQILKWSGTAWACATMRGGGTITGVTAGTDLTGGGSSGNVTLNLNTSATDTRYAQLGVSNSFAGNETVSGNVTSGGTVQGVAGFFSNSTGQGTLEAIQSDTTRIDDAIEGIIYSPQNTSAGVYGAALATSGEVFGVKGSAQNPISAGVFGVNGAQSVVAQDVGGAGVWGDAGSFGDQGVTGTADDTFAIFSANNSSVAPSLVAENLSLSSLAPGIEGLTSSPTGIGIYGDGLAESKTFQNNAGFQPIGVVGDAGDNSDGGGAPVGIWGAADSGFALVAENASTGNPTGYFYNGSAIAGEALLAGGGLGTCNISVWGNFSCSGVIGGAVAHPDNHWSQLYAVQSPENWFEDFGSGELDAGSASIALDPAFLDTISSSASYHVFLTPNGDCRGLYVIGKTVSGFTVREMGGGQSNISFDYRIVAHRKGYENVRMADVTEGHERIAALNRQSARTVDPKTRPQLRKPTMRKGGAAQLGGLPTAVPITSAAAATR